MSQKIGIPADATGVTIRGIKHFTECLVALYPNDFDDDRCTCNDWSPA